MVTPEPELNPLTNDKAIPADGVRVHYNIQISPAGRQDIQIAGGFDILALLPGDSGSAFSRDVFQQAFNLLVQRPTMVAITRMLDECMQEAVRKRQSEASAPLASSASPPRDVTFADLPSFYTSSLFCNSSVPGPATAPKAQNTPAPANSPGGEQVPGAAPRKVRREVATMKVDDSQTEPHHVEQRQLQAA